MALSANKLIITNGAPVDDEQEMQSADGLGTADGNDFTALGEISTGQALKLPTEVARAYQAGQISFDPVSKTVLIDTGFGDVRVNVGQEFHIPFFNDTGDEIGNGVPINASGIDTVNKVVTGIIADSSDQAKSLSVIGLTTMVVPDQTVGLCTFIGTVNDMDTALLTAVGPVYLGNGILTSTRPKHPDTIFIVGAVTEIHASTGKMLVQTARFRRRSASVAGTFTSQNVGAGTYHLGGWYEWATTSVTLNQGSLTQTFGSADATKAAHPSIVAEAAGVTDAGVVGLRVTGVKDSEEGIQVAAQTDIITEDITTLTADEMTEAAGKFSGTVTFELYVVSGSPTAYSLTFNYGYSSYLDFQNRDVTVTAIVCTWLGNANDAAANIEMIHHRAAGWTYAASGFVPGDGAIAERLVDQALAPDVKNNENGKWKRTSLDTFIEGSESEGIVIRITTTQNNTFQALNVNVAAVSEELTS